MALDDASQKLMNQLASTPGARPISEMTPAEARAMGAALAAQAPPGPEVERAEERTLSTPTGDFAIRVIVPKGAVDGILVWFHGGGWVIGSAAEADVLTRKLAVRTRCAVVNVDYRMAPEHRFPVAVDDCWAAVEWADANAEELVGHKAPLLVGGDSAGGNLAAVMALRSKERGGPEIALQLLVYPVTDHDFERSSYVAPDNQLLLDKKAMVWFWDHYVPDRAVRDRPEASPLRARDLDGLPPAVVLTAEHDVLRDEGEAYATRLEAAGVPVTRKRFPGQLHGFFTMVGVVPGHEAGLEFAAEAIEKAVRR